MRHPLLKIRKQYAGAWVLITIFHALAINIIYKQNLLPSLVESIVFNLIYFGIGISYWFVVKYNQPNKNDYFRLIATHLVSVGLLFFFIINGVSFLLNLLFINDAEYLNFYNSSKTWKIIGGLSFFIIIILFYYLTMYYTRIEESRSRELQLESLVTEAELQALKSQINPHFIFNSLNSINTLIHSAPEKASEMLVKLSQFLRFSLSGEKDELNKLNNELGNIQRYLEIEKIRFEEKLKIEYEIHVNTKNCNIPALLLQPLLENAIKFGVYENMEESSILIKTEKESNLLKIRISNNFEEGTTYKKGSGIGLKNVEERLRLLYKQTGLLKTKKEGRLFIVEINIPQ
jgi:sensor histidine kinase YesM